MHIPDMDVGDQKVDESRETAKNEEDFRVRWTGIIEASFQEDQLRRWANSYLIEPDFFLLNSTPEIAKEVLELHTKYGSSLTNEDWLISDSIHSFLILRFVIENQYSWPDSSIFGEEFVKRFFLLSIHSPVFEIQKFLYECACLKVDKSDKLLELFKLRVEANQKRAILNP